MEYFEPKSISEALSVLVKHGAEAKVIAGGTDVMVEMNFDHIRPQALLDLTRVPELTGWAREDGWLRIGAGVPYTRLIAELGDELPGLAIAARTVGSPQIRNRGTVGGNLGSASPAGDAHPPLVSVPAVVEVASTRGTRTVPIGEFFTGPKRSALAADELITAVTVPKAAGPQQFAKVGTRNAMVIAVCSFGLSLDLAARTVGTGIGSAGPTPLRAEAAQDYAAEVLPWDGGELDDEVAREFGELVAAAARPIDDVRGSAAYRRHALSVLARRTLRWAWQDRGRWS